MDVYARIWVTWFTHLNAVTYERTRGSTCATLYLRPAFLSIQVYPEKTSVWLQVSIQMEDMKIETFVYRTQKKTFVNYHKEGFHPFYKG